MGLKLLLKTSLQLAAASSEPRTCRIPPRPRVRRRGVGARARGIRRRARTSASRAMERCDSLPAWPNRCCVRWMRDSRLPATPWVAVWRSRYSGSRPNASGGIALLDTGTQPARRGRAWRTRSRRSTRTGRNSAQRDGMAAMAARWVLGMVWKPRLDDTRARRRHHRDVRAQQRGHVSRRRSAR